MHYVGYINLLFIHYIGTLTNVPPISLLLNSIYCSLIMARTCAAWARVAAQLFSSVRYLVIISCKHHNRSSSRLIVLFYKTKQKDSWHWLLFSNVHEHVCIQWSICSGFTSKMHDLYEITQQLICSGFTSKSRVFLHDL